MARTSSEARGHRRAAAPARCGHLQAQAGHGPPSPGLRRDASSAATSSRLHPGRPPEDREVVEQVGALVDHLAVLRALRGQDHLGRLLPHLLADGVDALGEQPGRVGRLGVGRLGAPRDGALQIGQGGEGLGRGAARPGARGSRSPPRCGRRRRPGRPARPGRVAVAVEQHGPHRLGVAARGALAPQLLAGAAPEPRLPALEGALAATRGSSRPGSGPARWSRPGRPPGTRPSGPKRTRAAARRRALRSRRRLPRRPQASPFSAASSAITRTAELVPTRAAPAPIIAWTLSSVRIPPGRLDPHALGQGVAHQLHVVDRRVRPGTRAGLGEVRAHVVHDLAGEALQLVVHQRRLDDDLHEHIPARVVRRPPAHRAHHPEQIVPHARKSPASIAPVVHDDVDLVRPLGHRAVGGRGRVRRSCRHRRGKVEHGAGLHVAAAQAVGHQRHVRRPAQRAAK